MSDKDSIIRIFIADDHTIFRDALKVLLPLECECKVVGEACDGDGIQNLIEKSQPDILLLDLSMPKVSGMEVLQELSDSRSKVKTIVLCDMANPEEITRIFQLGARGLVLKENTSGTLLKSIQAVMAEKYWVGGQAVSNPSTKLKKFKDSTRNHSHNNYGLTPREMDVVRAVVGGHPNKIIAEKFSISEQTVKHHITNVFDKLGVYNRLELTLFAFHHELVK